MALRRSMAVSATVAGALMALTLLPPDVQATCALDRAGLQAGRWWLLWSGHWVHFGWRHAAVDAAVSAALLMCVPQGQGRATALGAALCAPLLSLAILCAQPALQQYRGASGLAVWLGAVLWMQAWWGHAVARRWLLALALVLGAKLVWEARPGALHSSASLPSQVQLAWSAHVFGAVLGVVWALFKRALGR